MQNKIQKQDSRFEQTSKIILNNDRFLIVADGQVYDSAAAATGLAALLVSLNKEVTLYTPQSLSSEASNLAGTENFVENIFGKSNQLRIIFDCPLEDIERVDSSEENDRLSLKVEFRNSEKVVNPSQVEIEKGLPEYDAGFVLGVDWEEEIVNSGDWIWISRTGNNRDWAKVNVVESKGSLSESLISLISRGNFQIPGQAAHNFYLGIKKATDRFEQADSIALETAAYCLRIKEKSERQRQQKQVETKRPEEKSSEIGKPPVFTGATTPKV